VVISGKVRLCRATSAKKNLLEIVHGFSNGAVNVPDGDRILGTRQNPTAIFPNCQFGNSINISKVAGRFDRRVFARQRENV
jgi:hypothetical protein